MKEWRKNEESEKKVQMSMYEQIQQTREKNWYVYKLIYYVTMVWCDVRSLLSKQKGHIH